MPIKTLKQIEWKQSPGLVAYVDALAFMEARVEAIIQGNEPPCVWFLEHPPLYTAGTSANAADMLDKERFPIFEAGRGGEYTYHGPGQLVAYVMLDLKQLFAPATPDLRAYIKWLEDWIIRTLAELGVEGTTKEGMIGVWVKDNYRSSLGGEQTRPSASREGQVVGGKKSRTLPPTLHASSRDSLSAAPPQGGSDSEAKIAAIGVRVRKWVSFHGLCINVAPDLSHYAGIVPCGIKEYGVTSLEKLGVHATLQDVQKAMQYCLKN